MDRYVLSLLVDCHQLFYVYKYIRYVAKIASCFIFYHSVYTVLAMAQTARRQITKMQPMTKTAQKLLSSV